MTLFDLEVFVRVADLGSLSAAARALDITPAVASLAIKRLEKRLGVHLLIRSTRSLRLSAEGKGYLDSARLALGALAEGEQTLAQHQVGLTGVLQLSAPSDFGRNVLLPWLDDFMHTHPQIQLQLLLNDRKTDLMREPIDVALRFGVLTDSTLVALPILASQRRVVCASPTYLARYGIPKTPEDLSKHRAILYLRDGRTYNTWRFCRGDEVCEIDVSGNYLSDDGEVARRWALGGHGIAYKAWLDVVQDIRAGRLIALLPQWQGELIPFNLLCPHRAHVSKRVRTLHEFLQQRSAQL